MDRSNHPKVFFEKDLLPWLLMYGLRKLGENNFRTFTKKNKFNKVIGHIQHINYKNEV